MPVSGVLGFPSLVLVVSLIVPVIAFVIRWKWRKAVSRTEEIKRLLVLASEEAARAELEASAGYGVVSIPSSYQCAMCYSPTTTRCARCKTVRYCSGKCQIIHWRQGHKEDCRPPSITDGIIDPGSDSGQKATQKEHYEINGDSFEIEGRPRRANPSKTCSEEPALSDSGCSPDSLCEKVVDGIKPELLADGKGTDYASESSGTSFSGFSDSATGSEVSDNVSVGESISSNEYAGSDGYLSVDSHLDMLETTFGVDQSKPLSPKFASLVDSVDSFTKLNKIKPGFSDGESHCVSNSSSGLGTNGLHEGSIADPCTASSGFWRGTLDSVGSRNNARDNSSVSNSNGATNSKLSQSGSVLQFSFSLSENTSPLHAQGAEWKGTVSDDALPDALATSKPIDAAALSENVSFDAPKVKNSASLKREGSGRTDNNASSYSHMLKSREVRSMSSSSSHVRRSLSAGRDSVSTDASKVSDLSSSSSERLNHVVKDPGSTSHLLKSGEVGHLSSSAEGQSVPVAKSGKVNGVQDRAAISSQVTSCSPGARSGLKTSVWKVVDQFRGSKLSKHYPLGDGCEVAGRYSDKGLFPYESFVKLYNWNKVELRPCGLINCGNSCYANAVLQCLAFTPPLTAYFLQRLHSKACAKKEWCFTCEFESLILKAKEGNSPLSPIGIISQLRNIGSQLGNGREEDAHEFLRYAIDTMQSVCLTEAGINASGSLEEETTLMGLTFGGYLRSKIKCTKCNGKSERQERMMDLTVEIEGDIGTLEDALKRFTSTEILDGENKYRCGRCKSYQKAKKKLTIMEAPNILTIALKRFQSGKFGKLNKPIQFPEILNLAPFISGTSDTSPIYRLYGVVVHLDIMNAAFSGHYVCYVKNIQNKWFKIDDSTVTAVELERVLTKGAYMLQYARCSPRAPRLIRNKIISSDLKNKATPSRINGKSTTPKLRSIPTHSSVAQNFPGSIPPDSSASIESFYSGYHRLQRILEEDSSSDNSSLLSSNSDEGSCSTDSTRDSTSTDEFSDYIFGDSGHSWNSPYRNPSDFDTSSSSSSSPSSSRRSPLNDLDRHASVYPETSGSPTDYADSAMEGDDPWDGSRLVDLEGKENVHFLRSDTTRHNRKLVSSNFRDKERLGPNPFHDVNSTFRKSMRERID